MYNVSDTNTVSANNISINMYNFVSDTIIDIIVSVLYLLTQKHICTHIFLRVF
jgi:hypothetical protein